MHTHPSSPSTLAGQTLQNPSDIHHHTTPSPRAKRRISTSDTSSGEDDENSSTVSEAIVFPPVPEDRSETRRIEENLQRWDELERQRRKVARQMETSRPTSTSNSFRSTVARTTSMLMPSNKWLRIPEGRRNTLAISEQPSSNVALEPLSQPAASFAPPQDYAHAPRDPFLDSASAPYEENLSPSVNRSQSLPSAQNLDLLSRPVATSSSSPSRRLSARPKPPRPLDLPSPRTPPPLSWQDTLPEPIAAPMLTPIRSTPLETYSPPETRWWHEWLCGFGEGVDRGGDKQAGKTNPFE
jgi:hypothetical protein